MAQVDAVQDMVIEPEMHQEDEVLAVDSDADSAGSANDQMFPPLVDNNVEVFIAQEQIMPDELQEEDLLVADDVPMAQIEPYQ